MQIHPANGEAGAAMLSLRLSRRGWLNKCETSAKVTSGSGTGFQPVQFPEYFAGTRQARRLSHYAFAEASICCCPFQFQNNKYEAPPVSVMKSSPCSGVDAGTVSRLN
jgi:hypothetical protein